VFCEEQEKELIYYLLKYGERVHSTYEDVNGDSFEITVANYIIAEIKNDELEFNNLAYRQLFDEYYRMLNKGEQPEARHFLQHPDVKISELSVDILTSEHIASKLWEKHSAYVESEEMILKLAVPKSVIVYKTKIIQSVMGKLHTQLSVSHKEGDQEKVNGILAQLNQLNQLKMRLSKELDRVVL